MGKIYKGIILSINMAYTTNFRNLEGTVAEYRVLLKQGKIKTRDNVTSVITSCNEPPEMQERTMDSAIRVNQLAHKMDIKEPPLKRAILSDQSTPKNSQKNCSRLIKKSAELKSEFQDENITHLFPEVYYFHIGEEMGTMIKQNWGDVKSLDDFVKRIETKGYPAGKGVNMYLHTILGNHLENNDRSSILFGDDDYGNRSERQLLAEALPLNSMGAKAVIAAFSRYHQVGPGELERGGRLNAASGGLLDMLYIKGYMEQIGYMMSGDQGARLEFLNQFHFPIHYGVETSWRIQLHSNMSRFSNSNKIMIPREYLSQPEIEGSDDIVTGGDKTGKDRAETINDMGREIAESALVTMGYNNLINVWGDPENFLQDFERYQTVRMENWRRASIEDYNCALPISGGFTDKELTEDIYRVTAEVVNRFYSDPEYRENLLKEILPSPNKLKLEIGQDRFNQLGKDLAPFLQQV